MNHIIPIGSTCLVFLVVVQATASEKDSRSTAKDPTKTETELDAAPLSVAPLDQVDYPEDRPEWIESPSRLDEMPHRWVVVSGPSETPGQSLQDLKLMQRAAVETYLRGLPGSERRSDFFPFSGDWIEDNLVVRRYEGEVIQEGLTLYENAVEMEVDHNVRGEMTAALRNEEVRQRLGALGSLLFVGLIGLIGSSAVIGTLSRRAQRRDEKSAGLS